MAHIRHPSHHSCLCCRPHLPAMLLCRQNDSGYHTATPQTHHHITCWDRRFKLPRCPQTDYRTPLDPGPCGTAKCVELACYRERAWWHTVQKWALNDVAPALPNAASSKPPGTQHTKQLQTTLRQAHVACVNKDYARAAMLQKYIQRIASQLNVPLCRLVNVTIPYITPGQRSSVATIINKMVRQTKYSAWERQAVRAHIRIVSSAPLNVRRAFERPSNTHEKAPTRPHCFCTPERLPTWAQAGTVRNVGGHYAFLPVHILHNGAPLRGTDPLPCSSAKSRQRAVTGLLDLARTLHVHARTARIHTIHDETGVTRIRVGQPSPPSHPRYRHRRQS